VIASFMMAHHHLDVVAKLVEKKFTSFGIERLPRISRAQSMDARSSQTSVAGYKAAITGRISPTDNPGRSMETRLE
jgi:NAD(P) transhydrogenase subunit alpha